MSLHAHCHRKLCALICPPKQPPKLLYAQTHIYQLLSDALECVSVYTNGTKKNLIRIQKIIDFSKRVIRSHCKSGEVHEAEEWPSAERLVADRTLRLARQVLDSGEPRRIRRQFVRNREIRDHTTRQDDRFYLSRPRINAGKRRFVYRAAEMLNDRL